MKACYFCGKTKRVGMQVSHSHKRSLRTWKPNLQKARIKVKGRQQNILLCVKCLKAGKHLNLS